MDLSQHLDQYESPILIVSEEARVMGVNRPMTTFLGETKEHVLGLLAGELIGCRYSRLAEGCGHTIHCGTCSIRQTVNKTMTSGADQLDVPAYLDQDDQRLHFRISAFNRGEFVYVVVDSVVGTEPLSEKV
jgi:nitrogen-specific signal transduction histidine kinase